MTLQNYLLIERNFSFDALADIYSLINACGEWVDGDHTYTGVEGVKKNKEIKFRGDNVEYTQHVFSQIIFNRMDERPEFSLFTIPENSKVPLITRTEVGCYYNPHQDMATNGDFSTTVFLNDDFEGGELCLWLEGKEVKFKPPAGSSITYRTGIPHRVNKVTKGHRDVAVFWTHSKLKDPLDRELYMGLTSVIDLLEHKPIETLEEAHQDPFFILNNLRENLLRQRLAPLR